MFSKRREFIGAFPPILCPSHCICVRSCVRYVKMYMHTYMYVFLRVGVSVFICMFVCVWFCGCVCVRACYGHPLCTLLTLFHMIQFIVSTLSTPPFMLL